MIMRRFTLLLIAVAAAIACFSASAEPKSEKGRKEWFREFRQYKHEFMIKELNLSKEQQEKFFPLYDEMDKSIHQLNRQTRALEKKIDTSKEPVNDLEYEKAAEALYELKGKEAATEMEYFTKFKTVLTPKQMYELKKAERKFTQELMMQHSRMRAVKKK